MTYDRATQNAPYATEAIKLGACLAQMNKALDEAQQMIVRKAQMTSSIKQTTALMDKYKIINEKLANLNKSFLLFKSYMDTFAAKVPCYIKDKCNAG
jgi:hypothetical protein